MRAPRAVGGPQTAAATLVPADIVGVHERRLAAGRTGGGASERRDPSATGPALTGLCAATESQIMQVVGVFFCTLVVRSPPPPRGGRPLGVLCRCPPLLARPLPPPPPLAPPTAAQASRKRLPSIPHLFSSHASQSPSTVAASLERRRRHILRARRGGEGGTAPRRAPLAASDSLFFVQSPPLTDSPSPRLPHGQEATSSTTSTAPLSPACLCHTPSSPFLVALFGRRPTPLPHPLGAPVMDVGRGGRAFSRAVPCTESASATEGASWGAPTTAAADKTAAADARSTVATDTAAVATEAVATDAVPSAAVTAQVVAAQTAGIEARKQAGAAAAVAAATHAAMNGEVTLQATAAEDAASEAAAATAEAARMIAAQQTAERYAIANVVAAKKVAAQAALDVKAASESGESGAGK